MLEDVLAIVREVDLHAHVIFLYRNLDEKHQILFTHLESGLERGERALYIASEETPQQIREATTEFDLDVELLEANFSLAIRSYHEFYLFDGKPDTHRTLRLLDETVREATAKGFKGLRVVGEMTCWLDYGYVDELVEYEKAVDRGFRAPITGICAYDAEKLESRISPKQVLDLISAHAHSIMLRSGASVTRIHRTAITG
ncbi:MAG: MEDS domain-containing protein [Candidatus Geothermarchaeales archaeon]